MPTFKDKLVIVAGGTGGLGKSIALAFLAEAARVAVTFRRPEEFQALKQSSLASKERLQGHQVDVTDPDSVETFVNELGKIDVLVNAVGGFAGGKPLWQTEPKTFDQMLRLNVNSGFVLARAVVPRMLRQGSGAIVNIASRAAVDHAAGASAYAASKAAAVAMIDSLAADLKGTPVRANSVLPSIIDTEANRQAMPNADFAKWPKPEEIAEVVLYLCSDAAKLISGASIPVYGLS